MKRVMYVTAALAVLGLSACGGGGSSSGTTPPPPPPPPPPPVTPTLEVTLTPATLDFEAVENDTPPADLVFEVAYTGSSDNPVVVDFSHDGDLPVDVSVEDIGNKTFSVRLTPQDDTPLMAGKIAGSVDLRLCEEVACDTVYPGSDATFDYAATVRLQNWVTYQRNAAHNPFINMEPDVDQFEFAWEWVDEFEGALSTVAANESNIFVSRKNGSGKFFAIDTETGDMAWSYEGDINLPAPGAPAYLDNTIVFTQWNISYPDASVVTELDVATGELKQTHTFFARTLSHLAPTPYEDQYFVTSEWDSRNKVYAFGLSEVDSVWEASPTLGVSGALNTPAVDDRFVYHYNGALDVFDRETGTLAASIADFTSGGRYYVSAPVIGSNGNVLAFAGSSGGGRPLESGSITGRKIVNYDIASESKLWRSGNAYRTQFAHADGVIYAARNNPASLDAIDEETGAILWSWVPPVTDISFHANTVVTRSHIFLSTDQQVYALNLDTREIDWSHDTSGWIAMAPDNLLVIIEGDGSDPLLSTGHIVAYRMWE